MGTVQDTKMLHAANKGNVRGVKGVVLRDAIPPRVKMWWRYNDLLSLNLLMLGALVGDVTNGYDNSLVNNLQILDTWSNYFGQPEGARLGLIASANRIGQIASMLFISPLMQKYGRRWPILFGSVIILVGVALQAAAQNASMFIVGRVILGFGNNIQQCACPILASELAYPHQRARTTAFINTTGSIGQIAAAWITYGTSGLQPGAWSWRLPTLLQAVSSIFQIIMVFFMPESPRWLVATGREQEARRILTKYHAEEDDSAKIVDFEMSEIQETLRNDKQSPWKAWFDGPSNRHRFFIIFTFGFMIQLCGNGVISYYTKLLLDSLGITDSNTQFIINGTLTISSWLFSILWALSIDQLGRRKLFLFGMAGMFCALVTLTSCTGVNTSHDFSSKALSYVSVAMLFVHGAFYKMAGTTTNTYFSEVAPYGLRDKAFIIKQTTGSAANLFSGFINPIGLDAIGWRYYIVWCCVLVSNFVIIFLFFPETKYLSLEESTQLFDGSGAEKPPLDSERKEQAESDAGSFDSSRLSKV